MIRWDGRCGGVVGGLAAGFRAVKGAGVGRQGLVVGIGLVQGEGLRGVVGVEGEVEGEVGGGYGFRVLDRVNSVVSFLFFFLAAGE